MKHTSRRILSGLLLIGLALLLVLQGLYSIFSGNIWVLIWMGLFVVFGLSRWFDRGWLSGLVFFYIAFFDWQSKLSLGALVTVYSHPCWLALFHRTCHDFSLFSQTLVQKKT